MHMPFGKLWNRCVAPFVAGGNSSGGGAASETGQSRGSRNSDFYSPLSGQNSPTRRGNGAGHNGISSNFFAGTDQSSARANSSGSGNAPSAATAGSRGLAGRFAHSVTTRLSRKTSINETAQIRPQDALIIPESKAEITKRLNDQFVKSTKFAIEFEKFIDSEITSIRKRKTLSEFDKAKALVKLKKIQRHLLNFKKQRVEKNGEIKATGKKKVGVELINDGGHSDARDCFKEISKVCENGALYFSGKGDLAELFSTMGEMCNELKRHHFSLGCDPLTDHFAETMAHNIGLMNPGLKYQRPGSEIKRTTEWSLGIRTDIVHRILSAGPIGSIARSYMDWLYIDDDGDPVNQQWKSWSGSVGAQAKILDLGEDCNSSKSLFSLSAIFKGTKTRGNYADHKSLAASMKYKFRGTQNYWKFINRSGTKSSMGSRLVAVMHVPRTAALWLAAGPGYKNPGRMPNFNQEKLNKGAFNQSRIRELGTTLLANRGPAGQALLEALKETYEPMADELKARLSSDDLPREPKKAPYNPITGSNPLPTPGSHRPMEDCKSLFRDTKSLEVNAQFFGPELWDAAGVKLNIGARAMLRGEQSENRAFFMKFASPHKQIDPDYSHSADQSHELLHKFATEYAGRPEGHLFRTINGALHEGDPNASGLALTSTTQRLESETHAIDTLSELYIELVELSTRHRSLANTKLSAAAAKPEKDRLEEDLEKFCKKLFGSPGDSQELQGFLEKLKTDPEYFIIRSYDAISIALGQVGMHLYDTKMHAQIESGSALATQYCHSLREVVERKYANLTTLMDDVALPINQETLFRGISIIPPGKSENTLRTLTGDLRGGAYSSLLKYINYGGKEQGPNLTPAFAIGGTLQLLYRDHRAHPNPVRAGQHEQKKIVIEGDGFMAPAVARLFDVASGLSRGAKRFLKFSENADRKARYGLIHELAASVGATAAAAHSKKKEISVGTRTPYAVGQFTYQQNVQWFRVASTSSNTFNGYAPIPLHPAGAPVTVSLSLQMNDSSSNVMFEALGKDVGYQLIQTEALFKMTEQCGWSHKQKPGKRGNLDFEKMRTCFVPTKDKPAPQDVVDGQYQMNRYFASSESILGIMEDYIEYLENPRDWNGGPNLNAKVRNEFHRFDDDPATWATIKSMKSSQGGSGIAHSKGQTSGDLADIRDRDEDPRPKPENLQALKAAMNEIKDRVRNKNLTAKERMELFIGGRPGTAGQKVFMAYLEMMRGYNDINTGVKATTNYRSTVVRPPDLPKPRRRT